MGVDLEACRAFLAERQREESQRRATLREQITQAVRTTAASVLPGFPQVRRTYLFGSTLHTRRADSDVDIAVEGELSAEAYFALWRELERALRHWPVDLIELDRDLPFGDRVRETAELIYERPDSDTQG